MTEDELRAAFDPHFTFPPIVKPVESAETSMHRLEVLADIAMSVCPSCTLTREVVEMPGSVPTVTGFTHEEGCPCA